MADPEWVVMAARARCKYAVPGMEAVEVDSHIPYATRDGVTQRYDVYGGAPEPPLSNLSVEVYTNIQVM